MLWGGARLISSVSSTKATEFDLMIWVFWKEVDWQYALLSNKEKNGAYDGPEKPCMTSNWTRAVKDVV